MEEILYHPATIGSMVFSIQIFEKIVYLLLKLASLGRISSTNLLTEY